MASLPPPKIPGEDAIKQILDERKEEVRIKSDTELQERMGDLAGEGTGAFVPAVKVEEQEVQDDELLSTDTYKLDERDKLTAGQVDTTKLDVEAPERFDESIGQIDKIETVIDDVEALGPAEVARQDELSYIATAPQGELSPDAYAEGVTEELDERATIQYQLGELMQQITSGGPLPPWASPAARKVNAIMQSRGMGASSMAAAALTQALMESGIQIASKDADKYGTIQLKNLDNKQRAALQNSINVASMDVANLNARLKAEVVNAQNFLALDVKNLDNEQKSNLITYQALTDGLFKDAAEENARLQFNAKNELQVEEFFTELGSQVETANANRTAAMEQFNVAEQNAMAQYNETLADSRQKFNTNMQFAVDQSNAVWRRETNTANTASQNEANRIDVQNEFNANQNALNNLWNMMRDVASWNFQKSENLLQRQHDIAAIAMQFANTAELYDKEQKDQLKEKIGEFLMNWGMDWATSEE